MVEKQAPGHAERKVVNDQHGRAFAPDTNASQDLAGRLAAQGLKTSGSDGPNWKPCPRKFAPILNDRRSSPHRLDGETRRCLSPEILDDLAVNKIRGIGDRSVSTSGQEPTTTDFLEFSIFSYEKSTRD
ncbi:hypothetical protein [Mesorhizobium huakuii]|uniref:Uncharacterized protein n=1 Tax=Mesorhizobium huakuii TaxID=28104 RepID=A0A7G6SL56_9HYPH|nr:hypothetical protein [Mesorhizobium huakuii]QND55238.1 hypothetical protein HB778_25705 [Mesorhizobium huakuii]